MSGTPTETEVQTQWRDGVRLLEDLRGLADGTLAGAGNTFDTIIQNLEGDYIPPAHAALVQSIRNSMSGLLSSRTALAVIEPCIREYGALINKGGGYRNIAQLKSALYEHFVENSLAVETRAITFDTSATASNPYESGNTVVGNAAMARLTVDADAQPMEACHVETKRWVCMSDQNSGTDAGAEVFRCMGEQASRDWLLLSGSGEQFSGIDMPVRNAGSDRRSGSVCNNSSFSTYDSAATPKFQNWTQVTGASMLSQDTTNYYRTHPRAQTNASLKITADGATDCKITQSLAQMRIRELGNAPYFARVMLNKTVGTAANGTFYLRVGSQEVSIALSSLGANWQELMLPLDANLWARNLNEASFDVELEWEDNSSTGSLLVDDLIVAPMTLVDGTYWLLRHNADGVVTPTVDHKFGDELAFTDTGGAAGIGTVQYWLWRAGLGYLPSATIASGNITFADP